jgi:probable rRNA maturation factor
MTDDPDPAMRRAGDLRAGAQGFARQRQRRRALRPAARSPQETARARGARLDIDVAEACGSWRRTLPEVDTVCLAAAQAALAGADAQGGPAELCIVLGDDTLLRALNGRWRGQDKATNVLSFPALTAGAPAGAPRLLGDVVLAFETVHGEATAQGKPLAHHLRHLVVHGVLHLLGFDHETAADADRMESLETAILARLGVPDPYRPSEAADG